MQDFRKLKVWEKSHTLALAVYRATKTFPKDEVYALTSQLRRCSSSVPSNIVEGCGRGSNAELLKFLHYAMGSAKELEYQLLLARDLEYLPGEIYAGLEPDVTEVERMLSALITTLKKSIA